MELYDNATEIFPWNRSLTGSGVEKTLRWIETKYQMNLKKIEFKTGKEIFDWVVPEEWNISDAWLEDPDGKRIIDFKTNNLHVVKLFLSSRYNNFPRCITTSSLFFA